MDEKERRMLSFQASAAEVELIDARADKTGLSRSEYLRLRAMSDPDADGGQPLDRLEDLIKHAMFMLDQTHRAIYSIAELQGKVKRFLSTEELEQIHARIEANAVLYSLELPDRLFTLQAKRAAAATNEK